MPSGGERRNVEDSMADPPVTCAEVRMIHGAVSWNTALFVVSGSDGMTGSYSMRSYEGRSIASCGGRSSRSSPILLYPWDPGTGLGTGDRPRPDGCRNRTSPGRRCGGRAAPFARSRGSPARLRRGSRASAAARSVLEQPVDHRAVEMSVAPVDRLDEPLLHELRAPRVHPGALGEVERVA